VTPEIPDLTQPLPDEGVLSKEQVARAVAATLAKPLLAAKPFGATSVEDLIRLADWILAGGPRQREYPFTEGDVQVLGPGVIASDNGSLINWLGVNYLPDEEEEELDDAAE
jgi:hypothetical protein